VLAKGRELHAVIVKH